mmetsp:Transcript_9047/g.22210  ORF Transcript_9047/g.22210 Transcript_9047/m.22210 type:complete len:309 (+) Transcript_9047:862-1788(+)
MNTSGIFGAPIFFRYAARNSFVLSQYALMHLTVHISISPCVSDWKDTCFSSDGLPWAILSPSFFSSSPVLSGIFMPTSACGAVQEFAREGFSSAFPKRRNFTVRGLPLPSSLPEPSPSKLRVEYPIRSMSDGLRSVLREMRTTSFVVSFSNGIVSFDPHPLSSLAIGFGSNGSTSNTRASPRCLTSCTRLIIVSTDGVWAVAIQHKAPLSTRLSNAFLVAFPPLISIVFVTFFRSTVFFFWTRVMVWSKSSAITVFCGSMTCGMIASNEASFGKILNLEPTPSLYLSNIMLSRLTAGSMSRSSIFTFG